MVSALVASARALRDHILQTKSRTLAFVLAQGAAGHRFAPKQSGNNDAKIGSRLDNGENLSKGGKRYKRYKFQLNKNADNTTLKDHAKQDSHKVWAQVDVEVKGNPTEEESKAAVKKAFEDIEKQL